MIENCIPTVWYLCPHCGQRKLHFRRLLMGTQVDVDNINTDGYWICAHCGRLG